MTDSNSTPEQMGVSGLRYAGNQTFVSLDDYLAHLQKLSVQDVPYYREVEPGLYKHEAGRQPPGRVVIDRLFTREELEEKFGFRAGRSEDSADE